jgi:hypothetical protein
MLFILAMDVLGFLISKAESVGLLKPLSTRTLHHRVSYYADDMVLFLHPTTGDINIILYILQVFREASGLCNNVQNSSVYPIRCDDTKRVVVQQLLHCEVSDFPCHYIGLPLSIKKLATDQVQPIVGRFVDQLPGWKADLLTKPGRRILVQFVLTSMLIYLAMAIDLPAWALKAIDKCSLGSFGEDINMSKEGIVKWHSL